MFSTVFSDIKSLRVYKTVPVETFTPSVLLKNEEFKFKLFMNSNDDIYIFHDKKKSTAIVWKHIGSGNQILEFRTDIDENKKLLNKIIEGFL